MGVNLGRREPADSASVFAVNGGEVAATLGGTEKKRGLEQRRCRRRLRRYEVHRERGGTAGPELPEDRVQKRARRHPTRRSELLHPGRGQPRGGPRLEDEEAFRAALNGRDAAIYVSPY